MLILEEIALLIYIGLLYYLILLLLLVAKILEPGFDLDC